METIKNRSHRARVLSTVGAPSHHIAARVRDARSRAHRHGA